MVVKRISGIKKKPSTLRRDNRNDVLRIPQNLVILYPLQDQEHTSVNSFKILSLEKRALPGYTTYTGLSGEVFL
jgi:hypothetical protein